MVEVPDICPTCDTPIEEGAVQCIGCGRRFDQPLTPAPSDASPKAARIEKARSGKGRSRFLRALGAVAIGGGIVAAVAAAVILPGGIGLVAALGGGLFGVGVGAASLLAGNRVEKEGEAALRRERQLRVLALAEENGGSLTATDVARALRMELKAADDLLTSLMDGSKVELEVDEEGVIHYEFYEIQRTLRAKSGAPKVRVEAAEELTSAERDEPAAIEELDEARTGERDASGPRRPGV